MHTQLVWLLMLQKTLGKTPSWPACEIIQRCFIGEICFWGKWHWNPAECVNRPQAFLEQDNPGILSTYRCYMKGAENSETHFKVPGRRNGNVLCWNVWLGLINWEFGNTLLHLCEQSTVWVLEWVSSHMKSKLILTSNKMCLFLALKAYKAGNLNATVASERKNFGHTSKA